MTTIAYKNGYLAFDGRLVSGGSVVTDSNIKGIKTKDYLIAAAGHAGLCDAFLEWGQNDFKQTLTPKCENSLVAEADFTGIKIDKDGHVVIYDENFFPITVGTIEQYAIGSGGELAMGAMAMGATAKQAIEIAAKYDVNTGGKIGVITFAKDEPRKRKITETKKKKSKKKAK